MYKIPHRKKLTSVSFLFRTDYKNVLNLLNDYQFVTLCEVILNTPKYENEFVFNANLIRQKPLKYLTRATFLIPNEEKEPIIIDDPGEPFILDDEEEAFILNIQDEAFNHIPNVPDETFFQIPDIQNEALIQIPHIQEKEYIMYSHVCPGLDPKTLQPIKKFKIAAGPRPNSVIVLKETEIVNDKNSGLHEIIEFVDNVTLLYLNLHWMNLY